MNMASSSIALPFLHATALLAFLAVKPRRVDASNAARGIVNSEPSYSKIGGQSTVPAIDSEGCWCRDEQTSSD